MDARLIWPWISILALGIVLPFILGSNTVRRMAQLALIAGGLLILVLQLGASPAWKLLGSSLLFLYVMKGVVLLAKSRVEVRKTSVLAYALYFSIWPGMAVEGLQKRRAATSAEVSGFGRGLLFAYLGIAIVGATAIAETYLNPLAAGWLALVGLLLAIHFGLSEILVAVVRFAGWPVDPLFRQPEKSRSLEDFWGKRWNLPFVEMDRRLFVRPLIKLLGPAGATAAIFGISGLLHEMAISYPAGAGWGLPLSYFAIQALGAWLQSRGLLKTRLLTCAIVLLPLPLLFHPAFILCLPLQGVVWLHGVLATRPVTWYLNLLLWALGVAQLLPLAASFQVPKRLNWGEDLPKLSRFNRKLMWTYGAFVVLTIISFSVITFALHTELLRGDRAALAFATFACIYWTLRLLTDTFYLKAEDWPEGAELILGHGLLNSLFAFLALGYGAVVVCGVWER